MTGVRGQLMGLETLFLQACAILADARGGVKPGVKRDRIRRAMHIKGSFSVADVARLTDGDPAYINEIIRDLVSQGDLEVMGRLKGIGAPKVYRVRHRDGFYKKYVMRRRHGKK